MNLRPYQEKSITLLYEWLSNNNGNVCVNLPTGSGKSVVIAELCKRAVKEWPETKILMLTRSMELIQQNADKLRTIWPNAPMGIYSASVGKKTLGEPITIGGPLSIINVIEKIGHIDLLLIDECHDISHKDEGSYRKIINRLTEINENIRVIGFTASPYRLGHGMITDKPAIFDAIIEPTSIQELINNKYLSVLRSKTTKLKFDTKGVHKRGGEFIESELQAVVDTVENNELMVDEVIARSEERKSWMFFCTGIDHAKHIADLLNKKNITAIAVTGDMPKAQREKAINDFRNGTIKAISNVNCLSTGFDHSEIDLLVLARPTMSPGVYIQQVGRGMRIHPNKKDCLVLDFAGAVETHGPIVNVKPPKKAGSGDGEAPVKVCDNCMELVHISAPICPACGFAFPKPEPKPFILHQHDIMGLQGLDLTVTEWEWKKHISRTSGNEMIKVTYYGAYSDTPISEYLCIMNEGYAGNKAMKLLLTIASNCGVFFSQADTIEKICDIMNVANPPAEIEYKKDGKYFRVLERKWN